MKLPSPQVIAIDDEIIHLNGLVSGLNRCGTACLPIHFSGDADDIPPYPHARVIFADLHLSGGTPRDHAQDFAMIGGLIEDTIQPNGPYLIVLWTKYPEQAARLKEFLASRLNNVAKPFTVQALDKNNHLDSSGELKDPGPLVLAIEMAISKQPEVGALLNWEERVLDSTSETVSSIMDLAESSAGSRRVDREVGKLLSVLAIEAVGEAHVQEDRFRAVNEALLPILADRISSLRSRDTDDELWQAALGRIAGGHMLSKEKVAKLNRLLHFAHSISWKERGAVIPLPNRASGDKFKRCFGLEQDEAAKKSFGCKDFAEQDTRFRWVLIQTQAACDYAQTRPGPLPFHLGLCMPESSIDKRSLPGALWVSPCFEFEGQMLLNVNVGFQISVPRTALRIDAPYFRLREQLLNDLIHRLHAHGSRPGMIAFR